MSSVVLRTALVEAARAFEQLDATAVSEAAELVRDALLAGKRVFAAGDPLVAQAFASALVGTYVIPRRSLPAIALTDPRQLDALGGAGDVVVAFGAFDRASATAKALRVVELAPLVPQTSAARAQECYLVIAHAICEIVDLAFVPEADTAPVDPSTRASESLKEYTRSELVPWRALRRQRKQKVVWLVGTFEAIEARHLRALRAARKHGDVLLVGVRAAGQLPVRDRIDLLAALDLVDAIVVVPEASADAVFAAARPDVDVQQSPD